MDYKRRRVDSVTQPSPYALAEGVEWWSCVMRQWKVRCSATKRALLPVQATIATQTFLKPTGTVTPMVRIKHLYFATLRDAYEYATAAMIGSAWKQLCAMRRSATEAREAVATDKFQSSLRWFRKFEAEFRSDIPATVDGSDGWRRRFEDAQRTVHLFVSDADVGWESDADLWIISKSISVVVISRDMVEQGERFARREMPPAGGDDALPEWYYQV
ncbi:hypothetical protein QKT49_gp308 [Acanthamoeba castellanii medusavirus]|uniref:Uncharacterized protein n=1 Tax=Acanthamoeba castellanii medusavirus J1 TaxID=3114988 RepID=A0A3T1CXD5_9VIRU|nr:hypothetical protein QKT49_gp308 [Acanthamoeba castellanii medusavirus]BBI30455.1 hypothetical protein [Acanthamoeba castellanii medusavirus J1]